MIWLLETFPTRWEEKRVWWRRDEEKSRNEKYTRKTWCVYRLCRLEIIRRVRRLLLCCIVSMRRRCWWTFFSLACGQVLATFSRIFPTSFFLFLFFVVSKLKLFTPLRTFSSSFCSFLFFHFFLIATLLRGIISFSIKMCSSLSTSVSRSTSGCAQFPIKLSTAVQLIRSLSTIMFCMHINLVARMHEYMCGRIKVSKFTLKQPTHTGGVACEGPTTSGFSRSTISPGLMSRVAT